VDFIKTRLQQSAEPGRVGSATSVISQVIKRDGAFGLWRGTIPTLWRNVPGVAMYFTLLQKMRGVLAESRYFQRTLNPSLGSTTSVLPVLASHGNLLAGATARVTVGMLLNPVSIVKARYESDLHAFKSVFQAFSSVFTSGPRELLKGAGASALRDGPYAGLFLFSYEGAKEIWGRLEPDAVVPPTIIHMSSGAAAGTFATLATHPFDVLKTKIQVRTESRYGTIQSAAVAIWKQRGISGFLDGASMRLTRKVLSSAIGWAVYEGVLLVMRNASPRSS